jgi:hypothetical protein
VNFIAATQLGLPLVVTGSQLLLLSNLAVAAATGSANAAMDIAGTAAAAAAAGKAAGADVTGDSSSSSNMALTSQTPGSKFDQGQTLVNSCWAPSQTPHSVLRITGGPAYGALLSHPMQVLATHAALAAAAGSSSLPLYHPEVLGLLVGQGKFEAAARVLRCLLAYLRKAKGEEVEDNSTTAAAAELATGVGGLPQLAAAAANDGSSRAEAAAAAVAAGAAVVPLDVLLAAGECGLAVSDAVQRCCAFRDAVLAAALGYSLPATAAAAGLQQSPAGISLADSQQQQQQQLGGVSAATAAVGDAGSSSSSSSLAPGTPEPASHGRSSNLAPPAAAAAAGVSAGGSLDTGMLDMSSFGDFGGFGGAATDGDDWDTAPQQQQQQQPASTETAAAQAASATSALDTGMLDMSAFGGFGFGGDAGDGDDWDTPAAGTHQQTEQQQQQQQPHHQQQQAAAVEAPIAAAATPIAPATAASAMETGMLDMSAFGGFGFGGDAGDDWDTPAAGTHQQTEQQQQQQQQQQATAEPAAMTPAVAAVALAPTVTASAMETGTLDISVFGGFGFGGDAGDDGYWDTPAAAAAAAAPAQDLQRVPQQQQQQQDQQAPQDPAAAMAASAVDASATPSQLPFDPSQVHGCNPHLLSKATAVFPRPPPPAKKLPAAAAAAAAALGPGGEAAAAAAAAKQQLLSRAEVRELHRLLGIAATKSSGSSDAKTDAAASTAYFARLLGAAGAAEVDKDGYRGGSSSSRYARQESSSNDRAAAAEAGQAGDVPLLCQLGLNQQQAQRLCHIAAALCTRTFLGPDGDAADDEDSNSYNRVTPGSGGPASAAALAASWASGAGLGADQSGTLNLSDRRFSATSSSGVLAGTGSNSSSGTKGVPLSVLAGSDPAFGSTLFQQLDAAGRLYAVNARLALLQLAAAAAAGSSSAATAAAGATARDERDKRFAAAVTRLFQPVSVSRSAATSTSRGAALLAHYPAAPVPPSSAAAAAAAAAAADGRGSGSGSSRATPPLSPGRLQQLQAIGGAGMLVSRGLSSGSGFGSRNSSSRGLSSVAMRSSMSIASMLSFSSLKDIAGGSAAPEVSAAARAAASSSWATFVGLLPGVTPLHCLWAAASCSQGVLLDTLLPLVPNAVEQQMQQQQGSGSSSSAAAGAGAASGGSSFAASGREQQHREYHKLWLRELEVSRQYRVYQYLMPVGLVTLARLVFWVDAAVVSQSGAASLVELHQ